MIDPNLPPVVVFGAGIAGLSAAHELAERGFKVHVIESRPHPLRAGTCLVGGMAATQWSRYPFDPAAPRLRPGMRRARPPWELDWEFNPRLDDDRETAERKRRLRREPTPQIAELRFQPDSADLASNVTNEERLEVIAAYARRYVRAHVEGATVIHSPGRRDPEADDPTPETLVVEGFHSSGEDPTLAALRAETAAEWLRRKLADVARFIRVEARGLAGAPDDAANDPERQRCVRFRILEVRLPGEHGYRFFPSFYRHLFDVMQRTPILAREPLSPEELARLSGTKAGTTPERTRLVTTARTVYDNLVQADYHSIEEADHHVAPALPRRRPPSLVALYRLITTVQRDLGFETRDLVRSGLKILKYLTTHADRRADEYEEMSWSQFFGTDVPGAYSDGFERALEIWPQALIGLRPTECDARTAGNATVQILLDMAHSDGFRDGTLNAPTSEAWLDHWQIHLESLGVEFHLGTLDTLRWHDGVVVEATRADGRHVDCSRGYVVIALPPEQASRLAQALSKDVARQGADPVHPGLRDLCRLARLLPLDVHEYQTRPRPEGPFRHFNGIQYYLAQDFALLRGHTYYASAEWGLTSISQAQFRRTHLAGPYRGIISVDIGAWAEKRRHHGRDHRIAWECNADEVAAEIWSQIDRAVDDPENYFPYPLWYHVDEQLQFSDPKINHTPYMLTRPREWKPRPGDDPREEALATAQKRVRYYSGFVYAVAPMRTRIGGVVLAGSYTKTFTRLGTMESANESARHAVGAILQHLSEHVLDTTRIPQWCHFWNLEDFELTDFDPLKDVDRMLFARGLPHAFDIVELERMLLGDPPSAEGDRNALDELLAIFREPDRLLTRLGRAFTARR